MGLKFRPQSCIWFSQKQPKLKSAEIYMIHVNQFLISFHDLNSIGLAYYSFTIINFSALFNLGSF